MRRWRKARTACAVVFVVTLVAFVGLIVAGIWVTDNELRARLLQTGGLCVGLAFVFFMAATFPGWPDA